MPKAELLKAESNHDSRHSEMRNVFNKFDKSIKPDSNVTSSERVERFKEY